MQKWADKIKAIQDERVKLAIVAANNHYAAFGSGTANMFRNMLGLSEAKWETLPLFLTTPTTFTLPSEPTNGCCATTLIGLPAYTCCRVIRLPHEI
ncbi:MAG TPA: hypothetical protein VEL70_09945 [Candidatus Acidoferrum sp.]|nr:hypothetical protein [Candidatus Acidoferrum sp.]